LTHATALFLGDDLQRLVQSQDMELPRFQTISLQADGIFPLSDWQEKSLGTLALSVDGVRYDAYRADEIRINADAEGADIRLNAAVRAGPSRLDLDGNVHSVWAENPDWSLSANAILNDLRD